MTKLVKASGEITSAGDFLSKVEEVLDAPKESIAERVDIQDDDYWGMSVDITNAWRRVFPSEPMTSLFVARDAVFRAAVLGVPPRAETSVSLCGCVWALQTRYDVGQGDVILLPCAKHKAR